MRLHFKICSTYIIIFLLFDVRNSGKHIKDRFDSKLSLYDDHHQKISLKTINKF